MATTNWNEIWSAKMRNNQISFRNIHWSERWNDDQSVIFLNKHETEMQSHSIDLVNHLPTGKNIRVLEIGPGTGPITIPLSNKVSHITAVEPSLYMAEKLIDNLQRNQIANVSIIHKRWEDIDPHRDLKGSYDLVLASHSLGIDEIEPVLRKMNNISSKYIVLFWFLHSSFLEQHYIRLWPALHGIDFCPLPKSDIIYQILIQMGIQPNLEPYEIENVYRYESIDEAVTDFSLKFGISDGNNSQIIKIFVIENSTTNNNKIIITGKSTNAKIWWERTQL
jgi:ubiquinone/menaquinone biosynthesis C-methylase UbiE